MILTATTTITLEASTGMLTVFQGDLFRTEDKQIVLAGHAKKLNRTETLSVLDEYVTEAEHIFGIRN